MKRGFFTWATRILTPRQGKPIQPKRTTIIYLFMRKENDVLSYDLWIDSKQTQKTLTIKEVRRILSQSQYADLIQDRDTIFEVPVESLVRYTMEPTMVRRKVGNGDFTSGPHNR